MLSDFGSMVKDLTWICDNNSAIYISKNKFDTQEPNTLTYDTI